MADVFWHVPTPSPNFNRARVKGFVGCIGCSNMAINGQALEWYYNYPDYFAHLEISDKFWTPNSNFYSCDYVFDKPGSYLRRFGVNIDATFWFNFVFVPQDGFYRIHVFADLPFDHTVTADLAPLAGYWCPIVPLL